MSSNEEDPLRFLKPRKKQFHLTPTKPSKQKQIDQIIPITTLQSANTSFEYSQNESRQILSNEFVQIKQTLVMDRKPKPQNINLTNQVPQKDRLVPRGNNENQMYNPAKYFSLEVQNFLRNKRGLNKQRNAKPQEVDIKQQIVYQNNNSSLIQLNTNTRLQNRQKTQQKVNLKLTQNRILERKSRQEVEPQMEFSIQVKSKNERNKSEQTYNPREKEYKIIKQQSSVTNIQIKRRAQPTQNNQPQYSNPFSLQQQKFNDTHEQQLESNDAQYQLKECSICGRKFNPNSYEKHVKVCQKVFYKKRKEFSSEKQRSLSNKKK